MAAATSHIHLTTHIDLVTFEENAAVPIDELRRDMPDLDTSNLKRCTSVIIEATDSHGSKERFRIFLRTLPRKLRANFGKLVGVVLEKPNRNVLSDCKKLWSEFVDLTPYEALVLLSRNWLNREYNVVQVEKYIVEVLGGRWLNTSQGIGIDRNGVLADGQHRLLACLFSGKTIPTLWVTGLHPDARGKIDLNAGRNPGTMIDLRGETDIPRGKATFGIATAIFSAHGGKPGQVEKSYEPISEMADHYHDDLKWLQGHLTTLSKMTKTEAIKPLATTVNKRIGVRAAFVVMHHVAPERAEELLSKILKRNISGDTTLQTMDSYIMSQSRKPEDGLTIMFKLLTGFLYYIQGASQTKLPNIIEPRKRHGDKPIKAIRRCRGVAVTLLDYWKMAPLLPANVVAMLPNGKYDTEWPSPAATEA